MKSASDPHEYELKKMRMSQDKDGYLVVLQTASRRYQSDLVRCPVGAVFSGTLQFENYVKVT